MSFAPEHTATFEAVFSESKSRIRASAGCEYLSLHRDHHHSNVYYTVSKWKSQADLDRYRNSQLFANTWAKTKPLFNDKPQAHSLEMITEVSTPAND